MKLRMPSRASKQPNQIEMDNRRLCAYAVAICKANRLSIKHEIYLGADNKYGCNTVNIEAVRGYVLELIEKVGGDVLADNPRLAKMLEI
jgi:hypothetical protein